MTTAEPDRLDRIAATVQQQQTDQRIAAIAQQQQHTQRNIDELGQILRKSIPELRQRVNTVLMNLDECAAELRLICSADAASRAAEQLAETSSRNEFRTAMLGLQTETRHILRELAELRSQRQNGNSTNQE